MTKSRRWIAAGLTAIATASIMLVATPAYAGNPVKWNNPQSGFCMSPAGGSTANNARVVMFYCSADKLAVRYWQNATLTNTTIVNYGSHKCLTPAGGSKASDTIIVQYDCDGHPSRYWDFIGVPGTPFYYIKNRNSGLCLQNFFTDLNTPIYQTPCNTSQSMQWNFVRDY
jgi:hypothetical protein